MSGLPIIAEHLAWLGRRDHSPVLPGSERRVGFLAKDVELKLREMWHLCLEMPHLGCQDQYSFGIRGEEDQ